MLRSFLPVSLLVCAVACSHGSTDADPNKPATTNPTPATPSPPGPAPTVVASAKAVQPFLTSGGISYLVPQTGWWVGLDYTCMSEMEKANPGGATALQLFEAQNPAVFTKLKAVGIDLARDLHAAGGYSCGGELCMYATLKLDKPSALGEVLDVVPGKTSVANMDDGHSVVDLALPGGGKRQLHLRVVPLDWSAVPAGVSARADAQRAATHLVIIYGVNEGKPVPDPFAALAAPADAVAKVQAVEKLANPAVGRCVVGDAGPLHEDDFSDMKLRGAQFVLTAPPRLDDDVAARALGFGISLDIEVALTVEGTPSAADATRWVDAGKAYAAQAMSPVMPMFRSMLGAYAGSMSALVEAAFTYRVEGSVLRLSFGTRNIKQAVVDGMLR